jgi:uncharacterized RDD family membrane protein YckC
MTEDGFIGGAPSGISAARAGFWRRFGALVIDGVILFLFNLIVLAVLRQSGEFVLIAFSVAYFTFLEGGQSGQTLGKRAARIRVVDATTGGPIGYGRGFVRYLGRIPSSLVFYLGYFWMLWDGERQTWHDKLAHDVVVPE